MNILILNWRDIQHPEAGGAEIHLTEIFSRLAAKGHTVTLLTTRFRESRPFETHKGIEVRRVAGNSLFNIQAPLLIRKVLKQRPIDCIIDDVNKLPFFSNRWFPSIPTGAIFHHLFGKSIYDITNKPVGTYVYAMERLFGIGYRNVQCCAVSKSTADELISLGIASKNMTVIENSVDTDHLSPDSGVQKQDNLLLYVGRLKRYKRVDLVFEAMRILGERGLDLRFVIAGAGDDEGFLKKRCRELGLEERVTFRGLVTEEEKLNLLRSASMFLNTSLKEGWGITNIEAAACGTAVVANDAPGLRDSVLHEKTGILFKENDANSLAESIFEIYSNPQKRQSFQSEGRKWAQKFSWDNSTERIEKWIEKIVSEKR
ncbi:Glycosyl transferase [Chitinispirillum alkaliphilum]|nr:Glycosyl transferase [Chitinispirillum alkaliphilum]